MLAKKKISMVQKGNKMMCAIWMRLETAIWFCKGHCAVITADLLSVALRLLIPWSILPKIRVLKVWLKHTEDYKHFLFGQHEADINKEHSVVWIKERTWKKERTISSLERKTDLKYFQ